jgi:hydroxymethylglutaryl-CoA lyase
MADISLVECPRDAMQGWKHFIPTEDKIFYLNELLKVGFDVLDCGSFVSAKAIPQLADTKEVLPRLNLSGNKTKLLAIVANTKGAQEAVDFDELSFLGFPFSISETFQMKNTNKTIAQSLTQVEEINNLCVRAGKELVIYISMGFGNPYGDAYSTDIAIEWVSKIAAFGIKTVALADTVGLAKPETIAYLFKYLIPEFKDITFGGHFHAAPGGWRDKIEPAFANGCRRFDTALRGIGGCPMANDELVGNIATESLVPWCADNNIQLGINMEALQAALHHASRIFGLPTTA